MVVFWLAAAARAAALSPVTRLGLGGVRRERFVERLGCLAAVAAPGEATPLWVDDILIFVLLCGGTQTWVT
jgi:hypothetical protein